MESDTAILDLIEDACKTTFSKGTIKCIGKWYCKVSILIPLVFMIHILVDQHNIYLGSLNVVLWGYSFPMYYIFLTMLWLVVNPMRKHCGRGSIYELCYNCFPVLLYMFLVFAQWKFKIAAVLTATFVVLLVVVYIIIARDDSQTDPKHKSTIHKRIRVRTFVGIAAILMVVPAFIAADKYHIGDIEYFPEYDALEAVKMEEQDITKAQTIYEQNIETLRSFRESNWLQLDTQDKVNLLQWLVNFECAKLGIPSVTMTSELISAYTLGAYDDEDNSIYISLTEIEQESAQECIETVCHETYHAYEYYLIACTDWSNPITATNYYDDIRAWRENSENYIHAGAFHYDEYASQPIEADAFEYGALEAATITETIYS